ncbi:TetR/AcrR family transcriptional regulator [uncultured Desulfuromusa sp.]|uniref:TetR/AcrR family transcriptional regulator n=1 Tax=uncultured Desulfuromusa sp. TaxID=219183 RepID=UPI002AA8DCAA|nr:TetR/AcrR family transcriptional regulator [uncultured Desulfuromusa sp.]
MSNTGKSKSDAILQAALTLFAENGFHCAPVSQLAGLAKVGVGSIYRYFKDKDELIHAVSEKVEQEVQAALIENLDNSLPDRQRFIQLITRLINYLNRHPQEFKFLEQYYSSPYGVDKKHAKFLHQDTNEELNPFLTFFAKSEGGVVKKMPLPLYLAMTFGPVVFLLRDSISGLVTMDQKLIEQTAEACWDAIKA